MDIKICMLSIIIIIEFNCFHKVKIDLLQMIKTSFSCLGSFYATTIAGSGSTGSGYSELYNPSAIYVDANRVMYILDTSNYRVLRWRVGEPLGYVVAGGHSAGSGLDRISTSYGMFVDNQYNIYISDNGNNRVSKWFSTNTTAGILVFFRSLYQY